MTPGRVVISENGIRRKKKDYKVILLCVFFLIMKDFVDIFMLAGGIKNINDPDHQKFIK